MQQNNNQQPNEWTCRFLDHLPQIPTDLLVDFAAHINDPGVTLEFGVRDTLWEQQTDKMSSYRRLDASGNLRSWIEENITQNSPGVLDISLAFFNFGEEIVDKFHAHLDLSRFYTFTYLVDTGGNNVITKFWKEPGQPYWRPELNSKQDEIAKINHTLELIDSVKIDKNRWAIVNAKGFHSVEGMTGCRCGIQISLDKDNNFTNNC